MARAAGILGTEVFTGKMLKRRVLPMKKKAWAAKFKKFAILAGITSRRKAATARARRGPRLRLRRLHREPDDGDVWLNRSEDAGALHRPGNREKLGMSGMEKIVAFDQSQSFEELMALSTRTRTERKGRTE